jgi:DNA polymerase I
MPKATAKPSAASPEAAETSPLTHLCLIDGSGYIFRAFFAIKTPMTRADGTPVGAVFGFCSMLWKLLQEQACDHIAVIFDAGRRSFRNDIYAEYKAHRPEPPPELVPQFGLVRDATRAFNIPAIEVPGLEADDLIATYARRGVEAGAKVTIISSDKDLMQLIRPGIEMFDPLKNKPIGEPEVREKFGVGPDRVVDVQSLAGDSTDNVPGVPGIGVKTAAELIATFGDLDTLLARAGEIKQPKRREALLTNADKARISRELVRLRDDCDLPAPLASFAKRRPDPAVLRSFLEAQSFRSLLARFQADGSVVAEGNAPSGGTAPAAKGADGAPTPAQAAKASGAVRYVLIQDEAELDRWIARATEAGQVAVDTETTSLDAIRAELVGVSLAIEPGEAAYIPLAHVKPGAARTEGELALAGVAERVAGQLERDRALARLKPMLEDPSVLKIGHNIKYDACIFSTYDIRVGPIDDTMLISYVLEGGAHGHGMDELANLHLGHKTITYDEVTGTGRNRIGFAEVALDKARDYAAEDAEVTLRLHRLLKPRLIGERLTRVYETIERPLARIIADMECRGVKVDREALRLLSNDLALRLAELEGRIHKEAGRAFNIGSPAQLGTILFDEMSLQLPEGGAPSKTKTGAYATGAEILEDLAAAGHKLPQLVLDWRQLAKLKSTYADALVEQINPRTGRVHTSFAMAATSTGRLSSSDPNLQNIPIRTEEGRKIRTAFVAEAGRELISLDYSQIELRLLAHVADIDVLREAFRKGLDIHAMTASEVFGVPVQGMSKEVRNRAKAINFGIIYGISAFGLARQLSIPQGEARAYIDAYFKRYPGIRAYMDATKKYARDHGFVTTLFGRRCHVPGIASKNPAQRSFSERAAINAPIQGGAADIIKRAMIRIPDALDRAGLSAQMLLQVHDELLFEVAPAERDRTIQVVRDVMENATKPVLELSVPLVVEAGHGRSWAEAH